MPYPVAPIVAAAGSPHDVALIAIGFAVAFVSALAVARTLLDYIARHGFGLFAWWRILVGSAGLAGLLVFG